MRLSDWRQRAPHKDSLTPKVLAVIEPILAALGAAPDPSCWIVWGEDPGVRYVMLVPTDAGLLQVLVRVNVPGEGPRASAKVIRWGRLQVGELGLETVSSHHLLGFQVESHILRGSDDEGDAIASFALEVFARIDGRPFTPSAVEAPTIDQGRRRLEDGRQGGGAQAAGRVGQVGRGVAQARCGRRGSQQPDAPALERRAEAPSPRASGHCTRGGGRSAIGPRGSSPGPSPEPGCGSTARASSGSRAARRSTASTTCRGQTRSS